MRFLRATPDQPPRLIVLLALLALAAALASTLPAGVAGSPLFQSPASYISPLAPVYQSGLPSPTLFPTRPPFTVTPAATATPTATWTPSPSPTPSPLPAAKLTATAIAASFLPQPTLVPGNAAPVALLPGPGLPLSAPPVTPAARPVVDPPATGSSGELARLIDRGVLMLGYLWLGCGAVAVAGMCLGGVWYLRRRQRLEGGHET